jgi:hypothetical protein
MEPRRASASPSLHDTELARPPALPAPPDELCGERSAHAVIRRTAPAISEAKIRSVI